MKTKKHISIFAIMLLLFWISGTIGYAFSQKEIHHKKEKKNTKPTQSEISAYQVKASMPVTSVSFVQAVYFLIFETPFVVLNNLSHHFQNPIFRVSFFEKVFEHIIAPQAP
ncbi:MAG: hypothetical protein MUC49_02870 [Raineya sp.]|jgi:hypothetical protein|nr:hypothetical protein [Raineya sp.]